MSALRPPPVPRADIADLVTMSASDLDRVSRAWTDYAQRMSDAGRIAEAAHRYTIERVQDAFSRTSSMAGRPWKFYSRDADNVLTGRLYESLTDPSHADHLFVRNGIGFRYGTRVPHARWVFDGIPKRRQQPRPVFDDPAFAAELADLYGAELMPQEERARFRAPRRARRVGIGARRAHRQITRQIARRKAIDRVRFARPS